MNALAWLGGTVAAFWISSFAYNTLHQGALGFVFFAVAFLALAATVVEAWNDWGEQIKGFFK